jgi:signal transduction histidine kinase
LRSHSEIGARVPWRGSFTTRWAKRSLQRRSICKPAQTLEERSAIVQRLDNSIAVLERLLEQARHLSLELRPPLLDDLGLVPALRWYLDQHAKRAGLRVEFFAEPALARYDAEVETACFRVAREALSNGHAPCARSDGAGRIASDGGGFAPWSRGITG